MEGFVKALDMLKGHRTHILVFICMVAMTVRTLMLDDVQFVAVIPNYAMLLLSAAGLLLGSKTGDALLSRNSHSDHSGVSSRPLLEASGKANKPKS